MEKLNKSKTVLKHANTPMTHWYAVTASSGAEVMAKIAASAIAARCNPIAALRFTIVSVDVLLVSSILNTRLWERRRSTAIVLNVMANERGIGYVNRHQPKKYQRWIGKFAKTIDWHPFTSSNVVNMNCGQLYPTQNAVQPKVPVHLKFTPQLSYTRLGCTRVPRNKRTR